MRYPTCDQVFDVLTRAPFPTGDEADALVDQHLAVCHECRQLAEALRPATDLFCEVMAAEERRGLPVYRGELATILRPNSRSSKPLSVREMPRRRSEALPAAARRSGLPLALVPAIALLVLGLFALARRTTPESIGSAAPEIASVQTTLASKRAETVPCLLASLPFACVPRSLVGPAGSGSTSNQDASSPEGQLSGCRQCHELAPMASHQRVCCTNCHAAAVGASPALTDMRQLAESCSLCHI